MMRNTKTMAWIIGLLFMLSAWAWAGDGQIDIATLPYTIDQPGSYIVTDDLTLTQLDTDGITITTDSVTLDLNGQCLTGPGKAAGTTGSGIRVVSSAYNIAIRNGTVRDWRFWGVDGSPAWNSQFEALRCYNNGGGGIFSGPGCTVSGNVCYLNGSRGIFANPGCMISGNICKENGSDGIHVLTGSTVSGNTSRDNGGDGIDAGSGSTVSGNTCYNNTFGGIVAGEGTTVRDNTCRSNTSDGIGVGNASTVSGNTCERNGDDGIYAPYGCTISGNTCGLNTGDGIQVSGDCRLVENTCDTNGYQAGDGAGIIAADSDNRITDNHCTDNDRGLDLNGADNIVSGNTLIGNTTPLDAVAGNQLDILISELPYTISQPGMYRLSGDLSLSTQDTNGITINADNVTLDLNGHSLTGPGKAAGTSGHGIFVSTQYNIAVRNGTVRDWRQDGVNGGSALNSQFEALRCYNNGNDGISVWTGCTVTGNTCFSNGGDGIYSGVGPLTVSGNTCYDNDGNGIQTGFGCTVTDNACRSNAGDGINADYSSVRGNACYGNTGDGIEATDSLVVENCCMANGTNLNLTSCTAVNNES